MKITAVQAIMLKCKSPRISDALSINDARQALLVKIETDTELYGIGEAFTYGSPLRAGKAIIEEQLAPVLIGENPEDIALLHEKMYWRTIASGRRGVVMSGISGIDIALWDLLGKSVGLPIYKLLGAHSDKVPAYASGGFYAPNKGLSELREELEGYMKKGYRDVKIKIGRNPDMPLNAVRYMKTQELGVSYEEDIRRLETAREVIGNGRLFTDINAAWTSTQVLRAKADFLRVGLYGLEEPIVFEDVEGYQRIRNAMPEINIMGFETEQGLKNYARLVKNEMVDVLQPDVGWGGGISELVKIGAMAHANHKPISLHSFGSAVHFAASLHVAAALPDTEAMESEENPNPLKSELTKEPFAADVQMNFYVPQKAGLGIELDWDKVERYIVR